MKTLATLLGALALGTAGPALAAPGKSHLASVLFRDSSPSNFSAWMKLRGVRHGPRFGHGFGRGHGGHGHGHGGYGHGHGHGHGHQPGHGGGHCRGHHDYFCEPASP